MVLPAGGEALKALGFRFQYDSVRAQKFCMDGHGAVCFRLIFQFNDGNVVTLTWEAVTGASHYTVQVDDDVEEVVNATSYEFPGDYEVEYQFTVKAIAANKDINLDSAATVVTATTEAEPVVAPTYTTVEEFLAAEVDDTTYYTLKGTITYVKDTNYGNFNLTDETGTVYVYGLTIAPVAKNDKSFAQLGLKEGDVVTLIGTRAEYNGTAQVGGPAYYISHEEGSAPAPEYSIDGKQWLAEVEGMQVLFDLGVYEEGALVVALPTMDGSAFGLYMTGSYEVVPADATSGKIVFTQYDYEWDEFMAPVEIAYSALSENSVNISAESVFGVADAVPCTAVAEPFDIVTEGTGGDQPSGEIANGEYWFIEPTNQKVMTALGETQTYGRPASADAVNGASTAKNAYTFTYNPDWSCYTIQDSYGRYLYSSMQSDGETPYRTLSVADNTPAADDENLAYYMWTVYNNGDGTYDVYNCATYYSISYSATYNNWEIYDPYEITSFDDFILDLTQRNLYVELYKRNVMDMK